MFPTSAFPHLHISFSEQENVVLFLLLIRMCLSKETRSAWAVEFNVMDFANDEK